MTRILVVDDELLLARALRANLEARGYDVDVATDGKTAMIMAADRLPDLVVLDLGLPEIDGLDVLASLRGWTSIPVIVLSARGSESDKIEALDAGADDYVAKPFGMGELLARVRAAIRRHAPTDERAVVTTADFTIDLGAKKVTVNGTECHLTPTEWGIVEHLVRHEGKLVSQAALLREVWGPTYESESHYLRVFMAQIRRKIEPDPSNPRYFITEPGLGYRFERIDDDTGNVSSES